MADVDSISAGGNATPQPMEVEVGPDQPQRNSSNASGDWQNLQFLFLFWQHHLQCGNFFFHFLKLNVSSFSSLLQFMKAFSSCVHGVQHHCVATCRTNWR